MNWSAGRWSPDGPRTGDCPNSGESPGALSKTHPGRLDEPTAFLRLRRGLASFGVDVSLTDFYPDKYPGPDGYITSQPIDASDPEHLKYALELAGAGCTAIITNTPSDGVG
jgi:hypothetical protein